MLAIRLRRQGRKNHAHYRMIVQDSRWHPTNGKVVAYLGVYDPYKKEAKLDTDSAKKFINHGAQPSPRSARLLKEAGVKLPKWVEIPTSAKKAAKHPEKLRKNQPKPEASSKQPEASSKQPVASGDEPAPATEEAKAEAPAEEAAPAEAESSEQPAAESETAPAEEAKPEEPPAESAA